MNRRQYPLAPPAALMTATLLLVSAGCSSGPDFPPEMFDAGPEMQLAESGHTGPAVVVGGSGPMRFTHALFDAFDSDRAMAAVTYADQHYRAPASDGFNAVLDHYKAQLEAAGFGSHPRLELREIETPLMGKSMGSNERIAARAWTPRSARLVLREAGKPDQVLHAFSAPGDVDRAMLPVFTPAARVEGPIALNLDEISDGRLLVIGAPPEKRILRAAAAGGATAVVTADLLSFNVDPTGAERHLDAVRDYETFVDAELPVVYISPRSLAKIQAAQEDGGEDRLQLEISVDFTDRPLRTLIATIVGSDRPEETVCMMSHATGPGACNNATGIAGLLENAVSLADLLRSGQMAWPSRSLTFLWGERKRMTEVWLESTERTPVAGIAVDMIGQSKEKTGAIALLERMPDPGALVVLPPDEHTPYGAGDVEAEDLEPNGLAVIARCAMVDVGRELGGWETAEHPFEGGSDHDIFIERRLPCVLFWHFTDFAFRTSLDRLGNVDVDEMRRTSVAIMSTALAVADPLPDDLDRYLRTLNQERAIRLAVAEQEGDPELVQLWQDWCDGARHWLRRECLKIP